MSVVRRLRRSLLVGGLCLTVLLLVGGLGLAGATIQHLAHHHAAALAHHDDVPGAAHHEPPHAASDQAASLRGSVRLPRHEHLVRGHGSQPSAFRELALDGTWFGIRGPTADVILRSWSTDLAGRLHAPLTRIRGPDVAPDSAPDVVLAA